MGIVPPPNLYTMTDVEVEKWWRRERRRMMFRWLFVLVSGFLLIVTVLVTAFVRAMAYWS